MNEYNDYIKNRRVIHRTSAYKSLCAKKILDDYLWSRWFKEKANDAYKPCFISPDEAFQLMVNGCFYCGDFATTLDRLNSSLNHTLENCVGCCEFCNISKAASDPMSFILRCVYRRTLEYYVDNDIWNDGLNTPDFSKAKKDSKKKERAFTLSRQEFLDFINGQCHYCQRTPKHTSIDKIYPDDGYTLDNCVSCCNSCNFDKNKFDIEEFTLRDIKVTERFLSGYFDTINIPKNTSHHKKHKCISGPVYQYTMCGKLVECHDNIPSAARKINKPTAHIYQCAYGNRRSAYGFKWTFCQRL